MLSKDQILSVADGKVLELNVPEWGGSVFLRTFTGAERDAFEASVDAGNGRKNLSNLRARFAVAILSDQKGERIFSDADAGALAKKSAVALQRILEAGLEHNGMSPTAIEDAEKN